MVKVPNVQGKAACRVVG